MTSKELILQTCDLPAVPMVASRIIALVDSPNSTTTEIQKVIMADQALSSRIIKTANSAFYSTRHNVSTISEAINIMGLNTIKTVTLAVSTRDVYKRFGLTEQKLWEHGLSVSVAAGIIAWETSFLRKEEAVMAGLMHDIGKVIMNNNEHEKFLMLSDRVHEERATYASIEQELFGFSHAEVGCLLTEKWGFPQVLSDTIRDHHSSLPGGTRVSPPESYQDAMLWTVALSDALCVKLGVGYREPMPDLDLGEEFLRKALKISEERYAEITELFRKEYIQEKLSYP